MNRRYVRCVKLDKRRSGNSPIEENGVLYDEQYGLYWEIKSLDSQSFNFAGRQFKRDEFYTDYINYLNEIKFGGFADWRVPLQAELKTLLDYSRIAPAYDMAAFDFLQAGEYWCGPQKSGDRTDVGWIVNFNLGAATLRSNELSSFGLAVRGECRLTKPDRFVDNGDGTVTDKALGLMWQQAQNDRCSYDDIQKMLLDYELAGHRDWRLPTMQELTAFFDESYADDSWYYNQFFECNRLKPPILQHIAADLFEESYVWVKNFMFGYDGYYAERTMPLCWRLVRDNRESGENMFQMPESGQRTEFTICGEPTSKIRSTGNAEFRFSKMPAGILDENTGLYYSPSQDINQLFTYDEALMYIRKLNDKYYGGRSDWRLPCCDELRMIADYSGTAPAAAPALRQIITADFYWTDDVHAFKPEMAWAMYMGYGCVVPLNQKQRYRLVAVNGGYINLADKTSGRYLTDEQTVTDTFTGRMWLRHELPPMSVQEWSEWLKNNQPAGFADWRMPDMKELSTLICREYPDGSWFDTRLFPDINNCGSIFLMAAETFSGVFNWGVNIKLGYDGYYADRVNGKYLIKPVRNI